MTRQNMWKAVLIIAVVLAVTVPMAVAQQRRGPGRMRIYDPATEVTVKGTVEEVKQVTGVMGWSGTHLILKTDSKATEVHVGPSAFLAEKEFAFATGDPVEVTGSKVKLEGADALLARTIKKGDKTLTLRNAAGIAQWSRSRWHY